MRGTRLVVSGHCTGGRQDEGEGWVRPGASWRTGRGWCVGIGGGKVKQERAPLKKKGRRGREGCIGVCVFNQTRKKVTNL